MDRKFFKKCACVLICLATAYLGYRWDQARKLDNYFIDQICLDAEVQASKGLNILVCPDGPIFDEACLQMKECGYNPYEIQQIIFKGYNKALLNQQKLKEAQEQFSASKNSKDD